MLVALALAVLASPACAPQGGEPSATVLKAEGAVGLAAPAAPVATLPASLGELPGAVARLEALREEVATALVVDEDEREASTALDSALKRVERFRGRTAGLPYDELVEASRRLAATDRSVAQTDRVVASRLRRVEEDARRVDELRASFESLADLAGRTAAPPAIRLRTGVCRAQLDELAAKLTQRRTEILVLVDKLAEARGGVAALKAEAQSHLAEARRRFAVTAAEPIWNLRVSGQEAWTEMASRLERDFRRVRGWVESNFPRIFLLTVVFLGGTVVLLHRLRPGAERRAASDPAAAAALRIMESPWVAGIPVAMLALVVFMPQPPAIVYDVAWLPAAPAAAWVVVQVLGPDVRRTVWVLAVSLAVMPLAGALSALPFTDRISTILQTAPLAVVLGLDLRRGRLSGLAMGGRTGALLESIGWFLAGCLAAAAAGSVVGWVGIAAVLGSGALGTLGGIVLMVAAYLVVSGLVRSVLASAPAQGLRMVRTHADLVAEKCLELLRVVGVVLVLAISVRAFDFGTSVRAFLAGALSARATVGSLSISPAPILGFVLVLWASFLLSRLLGFLLAEELLPRFDLRRGTAVAISGTTRYLVLLAGFVLAAGVAGVDLSKIGFLAGALGVGVGFGLQNIVSNFISGLILLFERPIQVGDAVDVSGAAGTVTQIGIRASTVHTFDGADVIVPNADLISKSVTNWTGSNPNRRFDVSVGVAYGSPLETTAQALLAAARRTPGVIAGPGPEAFFQSFGASSLDWTLRLWVKMDESPKVLSDLKRAVSEELGKAGIEIPFPQRDLNLRSVAPEVRDALGGRAR